jgi:hypothetical protein
MKMAEARNAQLTNAIVFIRFLIAVKVAERRVFSNTPHFLRSTPRSKPQTFRMFADGVVTNIYRCLSAFGQARNRPRRPGTHRVSGRLALANAPWRIVIHRRTFILMAALPACPPFAFGQATLAFTVSMPQPANHTFHVTFRADGLVNAGPRIITLVVDGVLNDGGTVRDFGWDRISPDLKDVNGSPKAKLATLLFGQLGDFRIYNRYLRTSEALSNFRARTSNFESATEIASGQPGALNSTT